LNVYDLSLVGSEKITMENFASRHPRKIAIKIKRIDQSRKFEKWV
jgi:hypothetical protein